MTLNNCWILKIDSQDPIAKEAEKYHIGDFVTVKVDFRLPQNRKRY